MFTVSDRLYWKQAVMAELRGLALGSGRLCLLKEEVVSCVSWEQWPLAYSGSRGCDTSGGGGPIAQFRLGL